MMEREFAWLLERYGRKIALHFTDGTVREGRCFLQAILDRQEEWEQSLPTPLGQMRQDRFVYLGEPDLSLDGLGEGCLMAGTQCFALQTAQPVYVGEELSHWWGIFRLKEVET